MIFLPHRPDFKPSCQLQHRRWADDPFTHLLGRLRPDFHFGSTIFSHLYHPFREPRGAQSRGHGGLKMVQPGGSRPPVTAGGQGLPTPAPSSACPHLRVLSSLFPGQELKTPPWRPSGWQGLGLGRRGGVPQTFGSCQEVYGLVKDSSSQDKQQTCPSEGSTGGGMGHGRAHVPEPRGWHLHTGRQESGKMSPFSGPLPSPVTRL